jgi:phosphoglycolate phosphatase-like HAD superfamily hydrolase
MILFDIDGTLVDTFGAGKAALAQAMRSVFGETGPIDSFDFHGRTDPSIVRDLLRAAGWAKDRIAEHWSDVWPVYFEQLELELSARDGRVRTYPGVTDLVDRLSGNDLFAVGLVTGNMERGAWRKLEACGIANRFSYGGFGSDSERREDLPPIARDRAQELYHRALDLHDAVVVGDTPEDIRCGRANGTRVLAVATGRHTLRELHGHGPDMVLESLSDTYRVLRMLSHE